MGLNLFKKTKKQKRERERNSEEICTSCFSFLSADDSKVGAEKVMEVQLLLPLLLLLLLFSASRLFLTGHINSRSEFHCDLGEQSREEKMSPAGAALL